jgi:hypothetical protein
MSRHQLAACASASLHGRDATHRPPGEPDGREKGVRTHHALHQIFVWLGLQLYHLSMRDAKYQWAIAHKGERKAIQHWCAHNVCGTDDRTDGNL